MSNVDLQKFVRAVPDFPRPGILFRDITPLLGSPEAFRAAVSQLADLVRQTEADLVVAAEARGFIFAAPLALELNLGFVPARKRGKLPYETHSLEYQLEYGTDQLEIHVDGIRPGQRVLVVDDLLATGGTVATCCRLIEKSRAKVAGCAFVIELLALRGAHRLAPHRVFSLIQY